MSNHPTGDTALSRAITTGAPVATNDAQAAELTQRWGVWFRGHPSNGYSDAGWCHNHCGDLTFEDASVARTRMVAWGYSDASHEVRPYPTPTPRPTPGGEWKHEWHSLIGEWNVWGGNACGHAFSCGDEDDAKWLASRLNAADAMEKALKAIADGSVEYSSTHDNAAQDMRSYAAAALRGGA